MLLLSANYIKHEHTPTRLLNEHEMSVYVTTNLSLCDLRMLIKIPVFFFLLNLLYYLKAMINN